jgi:chromatin segregation and condensation protein Rec8/ScpA/Scc1 (kleisin family)
MTHQFVSLFLLYILYKKSIYKFNCDLLCMDKEGFNFDKEVDKLIETTEEAPAEKDLGNGFVDRISQNQVYDIVTSRKPDWQAIIYDLIHTDQLDPWDVDIVKLTTRYFEKINELGLNNDSESLDVETGGDFYDSSKVLLAASLLLRIKSEFLLNKHLRSIDEILFGRKEDDKKVFERIEINEDDLPVLIPKTPLPRARRVTLTELMTALNKAMGTESRRIKREVEVKRAQKLSEVDFPEFKRIDLKDRIKQFYAKILTSIKKNSNGPEKHLNKVGYSEMVGSEKEEKLACFLPVLHLSNNKKLWLEQEQHLDEIWIFLKEYFNKNRDNFMEELEEDIEGMKQELAEGNVSSEASTEEKLEIKGREIDTQVKEDAKWITKLFGGLISKVDKEKKIDELTGFSDE